MTVCLSVCVSVFLSVSVCMFVSSVWPNLWVDLSETWHDDRFCPDLKYGLKSPVNSYQANEKKPNMVFFPEKPLELQI